MSDESLAFSPDHFSGVARVFPLPNLVMFPHVMQPLHIFEPRYRSMLEEAVEDDRLIALGVLAPGWESHYDGRPPLRSTACLCRIATHQRTDKGTYNVLLLGVRRIRLVRELPPKKLFRLVESAILDDEEPSGVATGEVLQMQQRLLSAFKTALPKIPDAFEQLDQLLGNQITLGMLSDIVAYTIDLDLEWKVRLLSECDVLKRAAMLLDAIAGGVNAGSTIAGSPNPLRGRTFPPEFSVN